MKLFNLKASLIILSVVIAVSGCLKDKDFDNGVIQSVAPKGNEAKVVELKVAATNGKNFVSIAINNSDNDTIIDFIPVNLSTPNAATEDVHVTVDLDTNLVITYDTTLDANGNPQASFGILDPALYTIVNPVVTIPKGSNVGYVQIKVKPSDLIGQNIAFGFKITSIQESGYTVSGNFGTAVAALVIKNPYDGNYQSVGYFDHPVYAGDFDSPWQLITLGAYTNSFQLNVTILFGVIIDLTVDPATNLVSLLGENVTVDPYDPAKNFYDPAARAYHLDFGYTTSAPRHCTCIATYTGPR